MNLSSFMRVQSYLLMLVRALPVVQKKPASSAVPAAAKFCSFGGTVGKVLHSMLYTYLRINISSNV